MERSDWRLCLFTFLGINSSFHLHAVFFKGQSVRDSTENFQENKGHSKVLSTGLGKIRDSLRYGVYTGCQILSFVGYKFSNLLYQIPALLWQCNTMKL